MRSYIIIEVEHGETTDPLDELLDHIGLDESYGLPEGDDYKVLNYAVAVDVSQSTTPTAAEIAGILSR